ncbi:hypothetical protein RHS04_02841 [Rhizoctonia solani]|uniref:Uncharacterized protein n=1 Tax=Rhizoctonia solani TaxID=456999 RepID=A0A8H7LJE1_9AGAM|nr:hypothetical protein RHS04_02841 [Rhizoctonia solani]
MQDDKPNNVLVLFEHQRIANNLLKASANEDPGTFWRTHEVIAFPVQGPCHRIFSKEIVPRIEDLRSGRTDEQSSGSGEPRRSTKRQYSSEKTYASGSVLRVTDTRPTKRSRNEDREIRVDDSQSENNPASTNRSAAPTSTPRYSPTTRVAPESNEWMRARIAQLESELESMRAARDLAVSEQQVAAVAHQAEQEARRGAMAQKSVAEAAKARAEVEQVRLLTEIEKMSRQLTLPREGAGSAGSEGYIKSLEQDREEALDLNNKYCLQNSHLESQLETANTEIGQLKVDLASAHEKLDSTQKSLESLERKYSSTRRRYEMSKEKLGTYKARLENERSIVRRLQDTLTPAAYKSLGATHETLGEFLSAMGLPPIEQGTSVPKEESE